MIKENTAACLVCLACLLSREEHINPYHYLEELFSVSQALDLSVPSDLFFWKANQDVQLHLPNRVEKCCYPQIQLRCDRSFCNIICYDSSLALFRQLSPYVGCVRGSRFSSIDCFRPNLITMVGFTQLIICFCMTVYYSPTLTETLPPWLLFVNGCALWLRQCLDAMDGKQARRTGASTPVGEFFDHGLCDALELLVFLFLDCSALLTCFLLVCCLLCRCLL